jgi:hypothetical protein
LEIVVTHATDFSHIAADFPLVIQHTSTVESLDRNEVYLRCEKFRKRAGYHLQVQLGLATERRGTSMLNRRVSRIGCDAQMANGPMGGSALWVRAVRLIAVLAASSCVVLTGCASSTDIASTDKPDTFVVAVRSRGGRLAWTRAHEEAVNKAQDYCERRGMRSSVTRETTSGVRMLEEHTSSVTFECHPTF